MSNRPESAFSGFFCFLHFGLFLVSRGEPLNRPEQIIRKDGVKQIVKGRFCQKVTEIIMLLCIHDQGFFCGQLVNGNQGFRVKAGGGGIMLAATGNFAEQPPLFHFRFELVQRIIHGVYLLKLIGNDLSYFPHGMGDF